MKKRNLHSLAIPGVILGVNLIVGLLAGVAFMLFLFKNDPILAGIPAVLALPGILLQPWFVLFSLMPGGMLLAPVLTTVVSVPIYMLLDRTGKLDWVKRVLARFKCRRAIGIIGGVIVCLFAVSLARYVDFPVLRQGVPRPLQHSVKEIDLDLGNPRYYLLNSFIDSEWLWQASLPQHDLNVLADKLSLHPLPMDQIGDTFRSMPPYWWQPVVSDQVRILATANFPMTGRGPDGWHALAIWNPEDEVIHMWIKDNF